MKERRSYIRFSIEGDVVLRPKDGTSRVIKAKMCDMGFIGVGIYSSEKIDVGYTVEFEISTRFWDGNICGEAKVKFLEEIIEANDVIFRMGIEFISVDNRVVQYVLTQLQSEICRKMRKSM